MNYQQNKLNKTYIGFWKKIAQFCSKKQRNYAFFSIFSSTYLVS